MNVFATVLGVLAVAFAASAALVPEPQPEFEGDDMLAGAGLVFNGDTNDVELFANNDDHFESTEEKLEAMGIDVKSLHPSILEDSQLLVVSIPYVGLFSLKNKLNIIIMQNVCIVCSPN